MIFTAFLRVILGIINGLDAFVFPLLPSGVAEVLESIRTYMEQGTRFVFLFVDRNLLTGLINWWINVGALLFVAELVYRIWKLIRGNFDFRSADDPPDDYVDVSTGEVIPRRRLRSFK